MQPKPSLFRFLLFLPLLSAAFAIASASPRDELTLRADPAYVSPNGDGLRDQAFFYPVVKTDATVLRWLLDVESDKNGRLARLTGAGMPALIMWDVLDKRGQLATDGTYRARMTVWGKSLHVLAETEFDIDTKAPDVQISVSTSPVDSARISTTAATISVSAQDRSPLERWQLQILDDLGRTVSLTWSTGAVVSPILWNGVDRQTRSVVPPGRYHAVFQAWDAAGNESNAAFADIFLTETSGDHVEGGLGGISVRSTTQGKLVQLDSDELFAYRNKRIVLSDAADAILSDLAAWINAYPRASVALEGYSTAYKNQEKDQELGSRYAWMVYSQLVKNGEVKASRIRVKGRGREMSARRRVAGAPMLANGVEVSLSEGEN